LIDAHQHFWRYAPATHGWIDERMGILKRDFGPADLRPLLEAQGFSRSIAVQASQTLDETRFLLDVATRHDFVAGVVGWATRSAGECATRPRTSRTTGFWCGTTC
jgi:L-fucono-1,5-lactonase